MKRLAFYFDSSACSGCKTCQMACKDKNDLGPGQVWRRVYEVTGGDWEKQGSTWKQNIFAYNLSMSCNHCDDPICAKNCPTKALHKREDGIVQIDQDLCVGCKYCAWVCPYGAPQFNPDKGVMGKCDFCADYIDEGKRPSCVDACPMRALDCGEYEALLNKYGSSEHIYPLPDQTITLPSFFVKAHKSAKGLNPQIANIEEVKID